jgi:signal transduction histidine kinase
MTSLYGNITLAKLETKDNPRALTYLQKAESSMEEAARLTRELLTFAKGGSPLKEHFNIEPLVRHITTLTLAGSDIQMNLASPKDLWQIDADRKQLEQVVANVVMNARHAMIEKASGTLFIELKNFHLLKDTLLPIAKGAYIKMTFQDQGCGIPKKSLDRIFDPYYTTKQDSCGMGLSICYSIISRHKGHISAASQTGGGTVVTIYLPAQAHPQHPRRSGHHNLPTPRP